LEHRRGCARLGALGHWLLRCAIWTRPGRGGKFPRVYKICKRMVSEKGARASHRPFQLGNECGRPDHAIARAVVATNLGLAGGFLRYWSYRQLVGAPLVVVVQPPGGSSEAQR